MVLSGGSAWRNTRLLEPDNGDPSGSWSKVATLELTDTEPTPFEWNDEWWAFGGTSIYKAADPDSLQNGWTKQHNAVLQRPTPDVRSRWVFTC